MENSIVTLRQGRSKAINQPKSFRGLLFVLGIIVVAIILVNASLLTQDKGLQECPRDVTGPVDAPLKIKVFDSPYCFYCQMEKPALEKIVSEHSDAVRIEHYDVRYCKDAASEYGITMTPGHVFNVKQGQKVQLGLLTKEQFESVICETTGECVA